MLLDARSISEITMSSERTTTVSRRSIRINRWARNKPCGAIFRRAPDLNRFGFIDVKREKEIANEIVVNTIGFRGRGISVDSTVSKLSGGERQGVAIGRAMHFEAQLIVLDEPTVALSLKEVHKVLNFVHQIKEGGKACIYISHHLPDVYEISDRFVIMDRGEIVADLPKGDITLKDLDTFLLEYAHGLKDKKIR